MDISTINHHFWLYLLFIFQNFPVVSFYHIIYYFLKAWIMNIYGIPVSLQIIHDSRMFICCLILNFKNWYVKGKKLNCVCVCVCVYIYILYIYSFYRKIMNYKHCTLFLSISSRQRVNCMGPDYFLFVSVILILWLVGHLWSSVLLKLAFGAFSSLRH
jgi:hypothetical protein